MYLSNGFAFDVFSILTYSSVDAEKCFNETQSLWTYVPVGNVVGVNFITDDSLQTSANDFSLVAVEANSGEPEGQSADRVGVEAGLLSVYYINLEREPTKLQENAVVREGGIYILTLSGDIRDSDPADHWTDVDGESHKPLPCELCHRCRSIESSLTSCSSCFYVSNISTLQSAMRCILDVGVSDSLVQLANELYFEPASKGFEQAKEIKEKLQEKAKKYAVIESEAKRFVAMTKEYGERVEEAYQDYQEDENFSDFVAEVENTSGLRRKGEEVTNQHAELIQEVEVLKGDADEGRREMNERANNLRDREILERGVAVTGTSTIGGLVAAGSSVGLQNAPALARVAGVVGRGGVIGLAVAGSATIVGLLGYGGYKLFKKLTSEARNNFGILAKSFEDISRGIENISRHLALIEDSLRNIETKWRRIIDDDGSIVGGRKIKRSASKDRVEEGMETERQDSFQSSAAMSIKEKRLAANIAKKVGELTEACVGFEKQTCSSKCLSKLSLRWN